MTGYAEQFMEQFRDQKGQQRTADPETGPQFFPYRDQEWPHSATAAQAMAADVLAHRRTGSRSISGCSPAQIVQEGTSRLRCPPWSNEHGCWVWEMGGPGPPPPPPPPPVGQVRGMETCRRKWGMGW